MTLTGTGREYLITYYLGIPFRQLRARHWPTAALAKQRWQVKPNAWLPGFLGGEKPGRHVILEGIAAIARVRFHKSRLWRQKL
jgi:hypothetical protein